MPFSGAVPGRSASHRLAACIALLGACAGLLAAWPAQGKAFQLGLTDNLFADINAGKAGRWLDRARGARARTILLGAQWVSIAPANRPRGFNPANPADSAYDWGTLDRQVRQVRARGMRPAILVGQAPAWAEGPNRPSTTVAAGGTWKPKPKALGQFARAIARRYSGSFGTLPRVKHWQLWAEPNLSVYLTPQWRRGRPVGAFHYRRMLNAFYAGIKSVRRSNKVITGGTAPYGDLRGGQRMQPATFWRALLCLKGRRKLVRTRCRRARPLRHRRPQPDQRGAAHTLGEPPRRRLHSRHRHHPAHPAQGAPGGHAATRGSRSRSGRPRSGGTAGRRIPAACPPGGTRAGSRSPSMSSGGRG